MPDMRRLLADTAQLRGPSGALDGAQGDPVLRLAGIGLAAPPRQILDGMTVAVAAGEVHARVDSCRVAPQDLLRPADLLDEDAPIERRAEAQAGDGVGGGDLIGSLTLVLFAHRILGRRAVRRESLVDRGGEGGEARVELAHAVPQLRDEGARQRRR